MKKNFLLFMLSFSLQATELSSVDLGLGASNFGHADKQLDALRLTVEQSLWPGERFLFDRFEPYLFYGVGYWHRDDTKVYNLSLVPSLKYRRPLSKDWKWVLEGGIGGTYLTRDEVESRQLGSHLLFEDHLGLGLENQSLSLMLRFYHYSNAGLASPNQGINQLNLEFGWKFH